MGLGGITLPMNAKKVEPVAPLFSEADIKGWMDNGTSVDSEICALFVGDPKTCKTGTALDRRTPEEKAAGMKIICIELNSDNGCKINKKVFHQDDPSIIVIDPREFTVNGEGDWEFDYIKTMAKIKAFLAYIKSNTDSLNIKTIVFDGADVYLSEICENQMRMDEHLDISGGVKMTFWKRRNKYFYDVMNMLFTIDVDKIIITHFKKDESGKEIYNIQKDFPDKVHQIVEFRKDLKTNRHTAKIVSDRRDKPTILNKEQVVMEMLDGKKVWHKLDL